MAIGSWRRPLWRVALVGLVAGACASAPPPPPDCTARCTRAYQQANDGCQQAHGDGDASSTNAYQSCMDASLDELSQCEFACTNQTDALTDF